MYAQLLLSDCMKNIWVVNKKQSTGAQSTESSGHMQIQLGLWAISCGRTFSPFRNLELSKGRNMNSSSPMLHPPLPPQIACQSKQVIGRLLGKKSKFLKRNQIQW